jgi:hypothetical protein
MSEQQFLCLIVRFLIEKFLEFLAPLLQEPRMSEIHPHKEIKQESEDWQDGNDQDPCYLPPGVTIIENDDEHGSYDQ